MSMTYTINCGRASDCHAGRCRDIPVSRRKWAVLIARRSMEYAEPVTKHKHDRPYVVRVGICEGCGAGISQVGSGKPRKFCKSKACASARYRAKVGPAVIRYNKREHIYKIKMARVGCMDCGLLITHDTISVFEMDHRDPALKLFEVSYSKSKGQTAEAIDDEALKCDMVCANHHRMRTTKNGDIAKGYARFVSTIQPAQVTQFASLCDCPEWDVA